MKCETLIFNATRPLPTGGVQRFCDELIGGLRAIEYPICVLFGNSDHGKMNGLIRLMKDYDLLMRKVKVVHFITLSPYNIPFLMLAKVFGKRIVTTYHGVYSKEIPSKKPHILILYYIADFVCRHLSNKIVSPSRYLSQELKTGFKTVIIPNPVSIPVLDSTKNEPANKEVLLITSTNFNINQKFEALNLLLAALNDVKKEFSHMKLLIFGDGKNLAEFKSKNSDQTTNIEFMGFRKDYLNFLASSDAYIHISGLDNQPYSLIEAMMLGKVVLCSDIGGLTEMVNPNYNYVVSLDVTSIRNGLYALMNEIVYHPDSVREKSKENCSSAVKNYSRETIATKYMQEYCGTNETNKN